METIGHRTIMTVRDQVEQLLRSYWLNLNAAYAHEEVLKIGFSSEIKPGKGGDLIVTTKINFTESRVKDEIETTVNEAQMEIFGAEIPSTEPSSAAAQE